MPILTPLLKSVAWPLRRLLDPRFEDLARRLADTRRAIEAESDATRAALAQDVERTLGAHVRSVEEITVTSARERDAVRARLAELGTAVQALDARLGPEPLPALLGRMAEQGGAAAYVERLDRLAKGPVAALDGAAANLLNYANSHRGFAAQSELWLNPPIILAHREGAVELSHVNERIAEIPWAFRALGDVPPGARILDFGSAENALALSLASMGYKVTALDLREYPFEHPNLTRVAQPLEEWEAEPRSFDVVMCVSTLEHVGLDWYGKQRRGASADRDALARLGELLAADGRLVLTVPYGRAEVDAFQRRYDRAGLEELLEGWTVQERMIIEQVDERTWVPVEESGGHAAAMLVLRPGQG